MSAIEHYQMGLSLGWKMTAEEAVAMLEEFKPDNITSEQDNFWAGYEMAITLIKGEK